MKVITWQVQDDIKQENEKGETVWTRGPAYEMEMDESDQKIYRNAGVVAAVTSVLIVVGIFGTVVL